MVEGGDWQKRMKDEHPGKVPVYAPMPPEVAGKSPTRVATVESVQSVAPTTSEGVPTKKVVRVDVVELPEGGSAGVPTDKVMSVYEARKVLNPEQMAEAENAIRRRKKKTKKRITG
jgi:hypothetical protein